MKKIISIVLAFGLLLCLCSCASNQEQQFIGTWVGLDENGESVELVIKKDGKEVKDSRYIFEWELVSENTIAILQESSIGTLSATGTLTNGTLIIESYNWTNAPFTLKKQ